jgi:hypothetical protein
MVCYSNADRLVRILGKSGTTIIGVQIIWNGLGSGVPEILGLLFKK